ncbi:MAG: ATP-binding protein [Rubrivivax sp.]
MRATMWGTLAPLLLALPVLAVLAWLAIRRGLRPLLDLGRQLAGRPASSPASVQPVVLHDAPSEMQPVLRALNELLARIESMWQAERRFTADAAHELRTPIAAIRAQAQVALAAAGAGDTAVRQHALAATLEGCDRATRLVEQLLTLSRLEAGARVAMQPVDLAAVAHQVLADLAPRALGRSQELGLDVAPDERGTHLIEGDATLLAVLLRNLVDNALRYSPGGARVSVAVQRTNGHPCLTVEDSGPGIAAAERERLGQRFHRGEGHAASGSGLGWSIVERIAESHGLQIAVDSSPTLGGLRVRLTAPGRAGP